MRPLAALALIGIVTAGGGCMHSPPPLPTELAQAQKHEGTPEVAVQEYAALYARCQGGTAPHLMNPKDDCGIVAFRLAQSLERAARYPEAVQVFESVRTLSRDRVRIARAAVRVATLQAQQLGTPAAALQTCRRVLAEFPAEVPAEDALHLLVRLQAAAPDLMDELDRLAETLRPFETIASFALLYGAQVAERRELPAEALERYDEIVRRYRRGPLLDDALVAAARLLRKLGRSAAAAERLERLVQSYTAASLVGHYHQALLIESTLQLGELYLRELHRPEQAIATLKLLLQRQPSSRLGDDALLVMAEAALQRPSGGRTEACRYLDRLLTGYPDSNRRRAAQKLQREQQCP